MGEAWGPGAEGVHATRLPELLNAEGLPPCRPQTLGFFAWACQFYVQTPSSLPWPLLAAHLLRIVDPDTGKPLTDAQYKTELAILFGAVRPHGKHLAGSGGGRDCTQRRIAVRPPFHAAASPLPGCFPPPQGFETTSHAITWTLAALAAHPRIQARLAAELAAAGLAPTAGAPVPREFEWGDLNRLPYLGAVIKESLRLYSPAPLGNLRYADRDVMVRRHCETPPSGWTHG